MIADSFLQFGGEPSVKVIILIAFQYIYIIHHTLKHLGKDYPPNRRILYPRFLRSIGVISKFKSHTQNIKKIFLWESRYFILNFNIDILKLFRI